MASSVQAHIAAAASKVMTPPQAGPMTKIAPPAPATAKAAVEPNVIFAMPIHTTNSGFRKAGSI